VLALNKHDRFVQELCEKIKDDYELISTNVKLTKKKRSLGEIDVLAKRGNLFDIYEVKCSYRLTKARKQVKSLRKHFKLSINNFYFYCGATSSLILI
jgi:Holliday junction resolvase-like predicted endonuclease